MTRQEGEAAFSHRIWDYSSEVTCNPIQHDNKNLCINFYLGRGPLVGAKYNSIL